MKILTLIARLLDYPEAELLGARQEVLALIDASSMPDEHQQALRHFVEQRFNGDLLDWQEEYDGLFERGRSLSLLIYEHIHGESRDRGQAMVELLAQYRAAGLEIAEQELPDYLPLFLEFASTQQHEARGWLADIAPVLGLLAVRLEKRSPDYAGLFKALLALSQAPVDLQELRSQISAEKADHTPKALDKVWEEEAVTFGGDAINGGCPSQRQRPEPGQRRDQQVPIEFFDTPAPVRLN
ncbi:nitrate reductase molybdenum cofactor assembly chaperone [Bowmanella denitrificans]|uniref:nitrate reductase molybdenum cofactor assembly chaperone n=1 Tax=Bowmanella denitrificans TaxID=366582 RepID=UPI000C99ECB6|nr:nitrate reductase molybdenum cofactor assembly chaperone [Bowmanella denitrificans]